MKNNMLIGIKQFFASGKGTKFAAVVGVIGIILIFISSFSDGEKFENQVENEPSLGAEEYTLYATKELKAVVMAITGEASPTVYITAESGVTHIYATETKHEADTSEESLVIIKNSDGDQEGLVLSQQQPQIKGVVVVSERADEAVIREKIIEAVRTAYDLPANKVCVVAKYKLSD